MSSTTFEPKKSVCIITGGAHGIGKALAIHLAKNHAKRISIVDLSLAAAQSVVDNDLPPGVGLAIEANCAVEMDMRRVIIETEHSVRGEPIDAFFCNAGIPSNGDGVENSNDEWERIWQVNVMQSVYVARHLFPRFEKRGKGVLVITASSAGLLTLPGSVAYSVTKHAAVGLAEALHIANAPKNIHVSCLCPMGVRTGMLGDTDGGPTGVDGVLSPEEVAKITIGAVMDGKFMILPHKKVQLYFSGKASNYEKWIHGMRKMYDVFGEDMRKLPNMSSAKL